MENEIIRQFSRNASTYDDFALVQRSTAKRLLELFSPIGPVKKILDWGCGTGLLTKQLAEKFPSIPIKGYDPSEPMINIARRGTPSKDLLFSNTPPEQEQFDLIASNAAFHWFKDTAHQLKIIRNLLSPQGTLLFNAYGPGTYSELNHITQTLFNKTIPAAEFPPMTAWKSFFSEIWKISALSEEIQTISYLTLTDLFKSIKHTGTRGDKGGLNLWVTRKMLREMEFCYLKKFGTIRASFQIFYFVLHPTPLTLSK